MPAKNKSVRFIHSSDWQLGMTRFFLSKEAAPRFSQARIDAITKLGELATENNACFIVVAGDVFESNQLSRQTVIRTLDVLKSLPVPVFLLPGNHDPLDVSSIFNTTEFLRAGDHVIVIRDTTPIPVPGFDNVEVIGAPWPTKHPSSDLCGDLVSGLEKAGQKIQIVVAHGQVDTLSPDTSKPEVIQLSKVETAVKDGLVQYVALGDRHSVTEVGNTGKVWYSGAPLATAFNELDPNKALLIDLDSDGKCKVQPLDVGRWQFVVQQFPINSEDEVEEFAGWLDDFSDKERTIIKVGFEGSINLGTASLLDEVIESRIELFASLRRRERTTDLAIVPDSLDQDSVSVSGYAKEAWDELVAMAQENDSTAKNALRLFYRLTRQEST